MSLLLSMGLLFLSAAPKGIQAHTTLEPPVIPYHKQATYSIVVDAPAGAHIRLPDMAGKFGGLDIDGEPRHHQEKLAGNRVRITETYTLDPIFIGNYFISAAAIYSGHTVAVTVPSPSLRVRDLTAAEKKAVAIFDPIAGPLDPPNPFLQPRVFIAVACVLALLIVGWFVYRRWRRPGALSQAPAPPPWEVAYQRLRALDAERFPEEGKYESFYVELSSILRHYIEGRFTLHAPERTTPEFLVEAASGGALSDDHQDLLAGFLRHSDRVKFAQFQPSVKEMDHSMSLVLHFIDETVPKPEPSQEAAA